MKRYYPFGILCLILIFSVSCQFSATRSARTDFPLQEAWKYSADTFVFDTVANDRWAVAGTGEGIFAFDSATGEILWKNPFIVGIDPGGLSLFEERLVEQMYTLMRRSGRYSALMQLELECSR